MQLHCPNCHADVPASQVNISEMAANCLRCDHVFFFDRDGIKPRKKKKAKPALDLPQGMKITRHLNELELTYSWRRKANGFMVFFGILWNLLLLPFIVVAFTQGEPVIFLFISLHMLVGLALVFYILSVLFNTTYVTVTPRELQVDYGPIPMPFHKKHHLSANMVEQLFIKKYSNSTTNGRPNWAYAVEAILKNQAKLRLVRGLKTPEYARFIEQEVEKFLHIEDKPVPEEWTDHYSG